MYAEQPVRLPWLDLHDDRSQRQIADSLHAARRCSSVRFQSGWTGGLSPIGCARLPSDDCEIRLRRPLGGQPRVGPIHREPNGAGNVRRPERVALTASQAPEGQRLRRGP